MAGLTDSLRILILADGAQAEREFARVGAASRKSLGQAETSAQSYSRVLTRAGIAMTTFGVVALAGLAKAAQASEVQNRAELELQNSMQNTPELAGANAQAFYDQASALQQTTKYGDEATISMQAMLGTFHLTQAQILELTPVVQDYASKFGVDLVEASKQVGKAVAGNRGVLQRNGIVIDENAYAADHFTATLDALRENAGGFAEQEGQTLTGQLARLKNNMGDVVEVIGKGAADAFSKLATPVEKVSELMKGLNPQTAATIGGILTFGAAAITALGAVSLLTGVLIKLRTSWLLLSGLGPRLWAAIANLIVPTEALTVANYNLAASEMAVQAANPMAWAVAIAAAIPPATAGLAQIADKMGELTGLFRFSASLNPFGGLGEGIQAFNGSNVAERIGGMLRDVGGAAGAAEAAIDDLSSALDDFLGIAFDVEGAQRDLRASFDDVFATAVDGAASADDMAASLEGVVRSTADLVQAQVEHGASAEEMIATVELTKQRLLAARDAGIITAQEFRDYNHELQGILPVVSTETRTPGLEQATSDTVRYKDRVYTIPRNWATTFQANTGSAITSVQALIDKIHQLNSTSTGSIAARIGQITAGVQASGRAEGGPVSAGELYVVGERGPELFVPGASGSIIPNGESKSMAAKSGGVVVNINAPVYGVDDLESKLAMSARKYNLARGA